VDLVELEGGAGVPDEMADAVEEVVPERGEQRDQDEPADPGGDEASAQPVMRWVIDIAMLRYIR
jgi:hypothetical protein